MKRTIITTLVLAALCATSCSNQASPVLFRKYAPLPSNCSVDDIEEKAFTPNGFLDVAWGAPTFIVAFELTRGDEVSQTQGMVGSQTLENENRNRPVIQQAVINYRLSKRLGATPAEFVINYTAVIEDEVLGQLQLLSPDLGQALVDGLTPANDFSDVVDILVDVEFVGEFSASRNPFRTGVLTYPIRAYKSALPAGVSCVNGFQRFDTAPPSCHYRGQSYTQNVQPSRPQSNSDCCPAVGAPGC